MSEFYILPFKNTIMSVNCQSMIKSKGIYYQISIYMESFVQDNLYHLEHAGMQVLR